MFNYTSVINRCVKNVKKNSVRSISFRSLKKLLSIYFHRETPGPKPPYNHICQIGDPVLRMEAAPIEKETIKTQEFQKTLDHLHTLMRKYDNVGLAAPQIGYPWQLFAIEITEEHMKDVHPYVRIYLDMKPQLLTYFINPTMEIIDSRPLRYPEICGSIDAYTAYVQRAAEVRIKALDRFGEPFTFNATHWLAAIAQHEMDHLRGILYVDRMLPLTFEYCDFSNMNDNKGKQEAKSKLTIH